MWHGVRSVAGGCIRSTIGGNRTSSAYTPADIKRIANRAYAMYVIAEYSVSMSVSMSMSMSESEV